MVSDPQAASGVSLTAIFFSIYYTMTGVHAIHIMAGMGVLAWILAARSATNSAAGTSGRSTT